MTKKRSDDHTQRIDELTADMQRVRADFENYRKRAEVDKSLARASGRVSAIEQLLPIVDIIERATLHMPADLSGNAWAQGVVGLTKKLTSVLADLGVVRIVATPGTLFNPEFHEAVQFDELAEGDHEVVAEELQAGYMLGEDVLRPSMVKVTKQTTSGQ